MSDTATTAAQETFRQFRAKLNELFQMDRAELDFGIYRIMNVKRAEVTRYLDEDLYPQVEEILSAASSEDTHSVEEELAALEKQLKDAGVDPDSSPKVRDLRTRLGGASGQEELRQRAFSHLLTFFSRYYDKGDFISKRRYKDGTYMIPYNGEEVKLVWANMDQYYIKTSEYLRDYRFFINPEKTKRMSFKLVEGDTERDNIKNKNRIFTLTEKEPVTVSDEGLIVRFEYIPSETKQADANKAAIAAILKAAGPFRPFLEQVDKTKNSRSEKTLLEKHIAGYTARNSEDYFIHKDLKTFLEREMDFFLKNEVLHIDDMLESKGGGIQAELILAQAIKAVGGKIIAMLAQIEEFQKKLWLKRKFVTRTNYLVTLDKIIAKAPALLKNICRNDAQREEWVRLFAIDEIEGYKKPLTEKFLKTNDKLVLDTCFFDRDFIAALLAGFEDIEAETDGLLVHSENFQALNLLKERYREKIKCIYIDPPYNTGDDGFVYKDRYQSSSWVSMMLQTQKISGVMLSPDGTLFSHCDEHEMLDLGQLLASLYGKKNHVETIIWNKRVPKNDKGIGNIHEYVYVFTLDQDLRRQNGLSFRMR